VRGRLPDRANLVERIRFAADRRICTAALYSDPLTRHLLPGGRTLTAESWPDGYWCLRIEDEPHAEIVGMPLNSTLAELLGYAVAHEEWPDWIDDLAREIEASPK
jgi:hypothetical protein